LEKWVKKEKDKKKKRKTEEWKKFSDFGILLKKSEELIQIIWLV
jgi:hypothetical protein